MARDASKGRPPGLSRAAGSAAGEPPTDVPEAASLEPDHDGGEADELRRENGELRERLLRALAETENVRRRAERAADEARRGAIADFARAMLTVADDLDRAIAAAAARATGEETAAAILEGVRATHRALMTALDRFGIRRVEALDIGFDPGLHEAVMELPDPDRAPGTVAQVFEDGYLIDGRLLRPARVAVTARTAPGRRS